MKKSTAVALITAVTIGALGITSLSPAFARGTDGKGPRFNFEQIDANGDGKITVEEMAAHREVRFTEQDTNGDGELSKDELLAAMESRAAERAEKRIERILDHKDTDSNGTISLAELSDDNRSAKMFERLDTDGDGAISKEEMENAKGHRFGGKKRPPASE